MDVNNRDLYKKEGKEAVIVMDMDIIMHLVSGIQREMMIMMKMMINIQVKDMGMYKQVPNKKMSNGWFIHLLIINAF